MTEAPFDNVFRGRRVLVTGHTGFKGGWLSLWLAELGAEVHGYALQPPTNPSFFEATGLVARLASHRIADIRDAEAVHRSVAEVRPEFVFHLAAQPLVRASYQDPVGTYATNVMGTVNLLEALRAVGGVRVCQIITTDKCYENQEWVYAYRENDRLGGHDPYSSSKACVELVVSAYARSYFPVERVAEHGVSLSSTRAGNVIGGGDWAADRLIPDCIRALETNSAPRIRNPAAVRPWQFVLDPLAGYLQLAARQFAAPAALGGAWNFGPDLSACVTVAEVERLVREAWHAAPVGDNRDGESSASVATLHEALDLKLDTTKAQSVLGWRPVLPLVEAVRWSVAWYRAVADTDQKAVRQLCISQLLDYTSRATEAGVAWRPAAPPVARS